jgi:hypothetical protein
MRKVRSVFHVYSDPGHGWIAVPRTLLAQLGIAHQISRFSYERGATAFLEEDCDAGVFFEAYKARFGMTPRQRLHSSNKQSRIRSYDHYSFTYRQAGRHCPVCERDKPIESFTRERGGAICNDCYKG